MARQLSAPSRHWYAGLPDVTAEVECDGRPHRITWRRGKLVLEDHDLLAERSLIALGSEPPLCLQLLEAWRRMRGPELLYEFLLRDSTLPPAELAFRKVRHDEAITRSIHPPFVRGQTAQRQRAFERAAAARLEREKRMWDITLIEALPPSLRKALALSVIVKVERHWHEERYRRTHGQHIESALTEIAAPLFERSARRWRRNLKPHATFVAESWLLAPGEEPTCAAWADSGGAFAVLSLPLSWFTEIWAPGIALVDDCFVLGLSGRSADGTSLSVVALRWERAARGTSKSVQAPAILTRGNNGGWSLHWA